MNSVEKTMYADFIMAMRKRGKQCEDKIIAENKAAENLYGKKYSIIRENFNKRVISQPSNKSFK